LKTVGLCTLHWATSLESRHFLRCFAGQQGAFASCLTSTHLTKL